MAGSTAPESAGRWSAMWSIASVSRAARAVSPGARLATMSGPRAASNHDVLNQKEVAPPSPTHPSRRSEVATIGAIARRCGGSLAAAIHWVYPRYEPPIIPTSPLDNGWAAAHSTVS